MKRKIFVALLLAMCGFFSLYAHEQETKRISRDSFAMNTIIRMSIYSRDEKILDDAFELLNTLDKKLSMYDPDSEISKVNSRSGIEAVKVSPEVIEAVRDSRRVYDISEGVFNPLIGAVTRLWKINQSDTIIPTPESLDAAVKLTDINNLEINDDEIFLKSQGCVLDMGGIAKGFASSKIAELFRSRGVKSALMDLGGNVYVVGNKLEDDSNWNIGVRDPSSPYGAPAMVLSVRDTSVVTSGGYERFKIVNGKKYTHFFDAKTGESIQNDLLSATVVTPDGSLADGLATAFMASGYEKSLALMKNIPDSTGVILIRQADDGLEIAVSENLRKSISRAGYKVTFF
ncbi:MAG: FAD:protein FMN transferase [Synergistaceae bacterium]|nr:FAD:protein FMN transferase [Synergistaceae bacterium]